MSRMLGYGEDAFTLWALRQHTSCILEPFKDKTAPSDCLIFYRPSFDRHSKENSSLFGEFDAILASSESIYLIESKWDNLTAFNNDKITLNEEQRLRHRIFSWYLTHWNREYHGNWENFVKEQKNDFQKEFKGHKKTMAFNSLLATNLEFILNKLLEHRKRFAPKNVKNVLLFFYNKEKSRPPSKIYRIFKVIPIDYSEETTGNFVSFDPIEDAETRKEK